MRRNLLVVAALLLTNLPGMAAAADFPEHTSKHARQTMVVLGHMGIDNKEVAEFVDYVDQRIDHGYFRIAEEHTLGGMVRFSYKFQTTTSARRGLVLTFSPDDSNWEYTASSNLIMANYRIHF
jgi:hypothetical protein